MPRKRKDLTEDGYTNVIYVDHESIPGNSKEFKKLRDYATKLNIAIYTNRTVFGLCKYSKAHVHRYGHIRDSVLATIVRRGGRVVSGNLNVD